MQSYEEFLRTNLTDRTSQKAYIQWAKENDDRLSGLPDETVANVLADATGMEQFRRFASNKFQRTADALGEFTTGMFRDANLQAYGLDMDNPNPRTAGQAMTDAGYSAAKFFGASDSTAKAVGTGVGEVPNIAGMMSMGFLGPIGLGGMFATMYGQGVHQAHEQGVFGGRAAVVGAVGPLISAATIGLARPFAESATKTVANMMSKQLAKAGVTEAIEDLTKAGGTALAGAMRKLPVGQRVTAALASEVMVETAQAGLGVSGEVLSELILDPKNFLDTMQSKDFWIPTLIGEGIEGAGGTIIGRLRNPIETKEATPEANTTTANTLQTPVETPVLNAPKFRQLPQFKRKQAEFEFDMSALAPTPEVKANLAAVKKDVIPELTEEQIQQQRLAPDPNQTQFDFVFSDAEKAKRGIDPASPASDIDTIIDEETSVAVEDSKLDQETKNKRKATTVVTPEGDIVQEPAETSIAPSSAVEILDEVSRGITLRGGTLLSSNKVEHSITALNAAASQIDPRIPYEQRLASVVESFVEGTDRVHKDHRVVTDGDNYISLRNPGTQENVVYVEIARDRGDGQLATVSKRARQEGVRAFTLSGNDLLRLGEGRIQLEELTERAGVELTPKELEVFAGLGQKVKADHDLIPSGLSFGEGYSTEYQQNLTSFLDETGIHDALKRGNIKLRFAPRARDTSLNRLKSNAFDYFTAKNRAWSESYGEFDDTIVITRRPSHEADSDLHELGHVFDRIGTQGLLGPEFQTEWLGFKQKVLNYVNTSMTANVGARMTLDMIAEEDARTGNVTPVQEQEQTRQHYLKLNEVMAQTFQGAVGFESKWSNFVKTNYPTVYKFLSTVLTKLKRKNITENDNAFNYYSPLFMEGRTLIQGMLATGKRNRAALNDSLRKAVGRINKEAPIPLQGEVLEAFTQAWHQAPSQGVHSSLTEEYKSYVSQLSDGQLTQADVFELVNRINEIREMGSMVLDDGQISPGVAVWRMPWTSRLMKQSLNQMYNLREVMLKEAQPEERERIIRRLGSDEGFDMLRKYFGDLKVDQTKKIQALLRSRKDFADNLDMFSRAVDEIIGQKVTVERNQPHQIYVMLKQVDATVRDWMFGRLDGQDGVPFADGYSKLKRNERTLGTDPITRAEAIKEMRISKWFPVLEKALLKRVTNEVSSKATHVYEDGTYKLPKKGERKIAKPLKKFMGVNAREDAAAYAATLKRSDMYSNTYVYPVLAFDRAGNEFYRIEVKPQTNEQLGRYNEIADEQMGREQDAETLIQLYAPEENVETSIEHLEAIERLHFNKFVTELKNKRGSALMMKMNEVVPVAVSSAIRGGTMNYGFGLAVRDAMKWMGEPGSRADVAIDSLAKSIGLEGKLTLPDIAEGWLRYRMGNKDKGLMAHVFADMADPTGELKRFLKSVDNYGFQTTQYMAAKSMRSLNDGQIPMVDPSEVGQEATLTNGSAMANRNVQSGSSAALSVLPGGVASRAQHAKHRGKQIVKSIFDGPMKVAQTVMETIGAGPIHHILSRPEFMWAKSIWQEVAHASGIADKSVASLYVKGTVSDDPNATIRFEYDENAPVDSDSAIFKIQMDPELDATFSDIKRLENEASLPFELILQHENSMMRKEAEKLRDTIGPENMPMFKEGLERTYRARYDQLQATYQMDRQNTIKSFAYMLNLNGLFQGKAREAEAFANTFADVVYEDRLAMLVKLDLPPERALNILDGYVKMENAMQAAYQFKMQHLEYTSERRMKEFHVSVIFKDKKGKKSDHGYYDFDTVQEAQEFIEKVKAQGHKVPNEPKNYFEHKRNYSPAKQSVLEIMARVADERKALVQVMLAGKITDEEVAEISHVISDITGDTVAQNEAANFKMTKNANRKFIEGRENLNMINQYIQEARAVAAAKARRATDTVFKLYKNDASAVNDPQIYRVLDKFREGIRQKDSETQRQIGQVGFTMFMGLNFSSAVIEIMQFPTTLTPMLTEAGASVKDAMMIPAKHFATATRAAYARVMKKSDADIWENPEHIKLIREAERQGRLNQRRHHDISQTRVDDILKRMQLKTGDQKLNVISNHMFNVINQSYGFFNRINAELSLVSTYDVLKKTRYGDRQLAIQEEVDLQNDAMMMSEVANGALQRVGRPAMFNNTSQAYRNIASAYWSLQSFANSMVLNQIRYIRKAINSNGKFTREEASQARKAATVLMGTQFLGMGVMGFTLMPAMNKLVEMAFGYDMEDELRELFENPNATNEADRLFMSEVASNGLLSAMGVPIDYGTRVSVAGIGPLSSFQGFDAKQLGGPIVGLVTQAAGEFSKYKAGSISGGEAALSLLPMGLRRGIRTELFDDGKIYDANKKYMVDATIAERIGMVGGFNTTRARKEMKMRMELKEAATSDTRARQRLANELSEAYLNRDVAKMQQLIYQGSQTFNRDPKEIARHAAEHHASREYGQTIQMGSGPASQRAARLYPGAAEPNEAKKVLEVSNYMATLGFPGAIKPKNYLDAKRRDYLRSNAPGMVKLEMNALIDDPMTRQTIDDAIDPAGSMTEFLSGLGFQ